MAIGGAVFSGTSKLFTGPLGIVQVGFKGYDLGKTTADTTLVPDRDIKDIMYQQEGSKAADHVITGMDYILNVTFGEIKTGLLALLMPGISSSEPADDGGVIARSLYDSMLATEAGAMKVAAINDQGIAETDLEHILNFYKVIALVSGDLINWGADTQRNLPVEFRIKYYKFPTPPGAILGAFGYWGDPTVEDVDAITWPDVAAPQIVSAVVSSADLLTVTFDENMEYQNGDVAGHYVAWVDGVAVLSTSTADPTGTKVLAITFTGAFTITDVITISISAIAVEDAAANKFPGVAKHLCTIVAW